MFRPLLLVLAVLTAASTLLAQAPAKPEASPATLRSLLLAQLHSTHDKAEWSPP